MFVCIFIYEHVIERERFDETKKIQRKIKDGYRRKVKESFCFFLDRGNLRRENRCNQTQQNKPNHLPAI